MQTLNRRDFLGTLTGVAAALALPDRLGSGAEPQTLPNIVYILADDMGYGDVSLLNEASKIATPHIDRIGREGTIFTDVHSGSAVCTPTRYGILTGRYAWRSRLKSGVLYGYDKHLIEDGRLTVPALLKRRGYSTAAFGKWHLGMDMPFKDRGTEAAGASGGTRARSKNVDWHGRIKNGPIDKGFDYFFGISASLDMDPYIFIENDHFLGECTVTQPKASHVRSGPAEAGFRFEEVLPTLTRKTVAYIEKQRVGKPFFVYFALTAPHTPVVPSKPFQGKNCLGAYGDFCEEVDWVVGQVLDALDRKGLAEDTLVIFTSDNGCAPYIGVGDLEAKGHYPSYVFRGYKADIFEGGHRIPFLARWPRRMKPGRTCDETLCLTDLMATCAALTGQTLPDDAGEDSYNILPALLGQGGEKPIREATVHHSINGSFSIRQGRWKLELCPGSGGWSRPRPRDAAKMKLPPVQLYDLSCDIGERTNVYDKYPEVVERLKNLLRRYVLEGRSTPGAPQPYVRPKRWPQVDRWIEG